MNSFIVIGIAGLICFFIGFIFGKKGQVEMSVEEAIALLRAKNYYVKINVLPEGK